jgi:cellulose synthase/poly-beta-1,6-N-acetylglucosamine synthase-like glycosyltransferase
MATAVLSLDLAELPPVVTVPETYTEALILIRYRGRPLGKQYVPVVNGRVGGVDLQQTLIRAVDAPLRHAWLQEYLGWNPLPEGSPSHATVAICTRDRPDDLRRCLQALMQIDPEHEILVVDNCPRTEDTFQVVQTFAPRVRYIRENRAGLNIARNRAMREARYPIIAFNDDDATPDKQWLPSLLRNFTDPNILCVTGLTMPLEMETKYQEWFEYFSTFERGFKRRVFDGTEVDPLSAAKVGVGANMALRRELLTTVGPFDEALDAGTLTKSGGDHEMFYRILKNGYRIVYEPEAVSWHRHRRTWEELYSTFYGYGVGVYAYWARSLMVEKEWRVLLVASHWFWRYQLPGVFRSALMRPGALPLRLALAELYGCSKGFSAYCKSRKRVPAAVMETGSALNEGVDLT